MQQGWRPEMPMTSLQELSGLLLRERDVLRLVVAGVADAGGDDERDRLLRSITSLELHRAIAARAVAIELGMDREPTLRELVQEAPCEWRAVLDEHLHDLESLSQEIARLLRPSMVDLRRDGNVIAFPGPAPGLHRSLLDFLA